MPTRLLSITNSENGRNDIIRIVKSSSLPKGSEYIALSHCWGQTRPLQLSALTYAGLRNGILVTHLPKTFRDTVTVSKWLNYSLIWIDCLCIMQDSVQDWEAESHMMKHVYSNAALTIAAAHARDSSQGLFVRRDPYSLHIPETSFTYPAGKPDQVSKVDKWFLVDTMLNTDDVDRSPLGTRAWAVQERALSARLLIFGESQMFYRCHVSDLSESFPVVTPRLQRPSEWEYLPRRGFGTSPWTTWYSIVAAYSRAYLTREDDKVIALAGIAGVMQDRLRNPYVIGLWGKNLELELLWSVKHPRPRPKPCIAPTWSWLSTNGEVSVMTTHNPGDVVQLLVKTSKFNINLVDPTCSTGNVHPGSSLTLEGRLRPARWNPRIIYDNAPVDAPQITFDGLNVDDNAANPGVSLDFDEPMSLSTTRDHIFLLPVAVLREADGSGNTVQGLLLVCENCSTPTYRRVARWILPVESAACLFSYGPWGPTQTDTITIA
ncbi:hypothetical protein CcaCcLH18_10339 [Colletotrichum camelliae]|nr:hypothetical protein CcaCcLH18_10339 [Colletotrichum camelliae]